MGVKQEDKQGAGSVILEATSPGQSLTVYYYPDHYTNEGHY